MRATATRLVRSVALVVVLLAPGAGAVDNPACPSGWYAGPGGACFLATCPAHTCKGNDECKQTSLCFMPRKQGEPATPNGPPIIVQDALDVCLNNAVCTPGGTCATGGLCLAPGASPAAAPPNATPPPTPYPTPNDAPREAPRDGKRGGGCGACSVGAAPVTTGAPGLLLATAVLAAFLGRRRSRFA